MRAICLKDRSRNSQIVDLLGFHISEYKPFNHKDISIGNFKRDKVDLSMSGKVKSLTTASDFEPTTNKNGDCLAEKKRKPRIWARGVYVGTFPVVRIKIERLINLSEFVVWTIYMVVRKIRENFKKQKS